MYEPDETGALSDDSDTISDETASLSHESEADAAPYDRQLGEPAKWYGRFHAYLLLGSGRSLYQAYRQEREGRGATWRGKRGDSGVPKSWRLVAEKWDWEVRAAAWDNAKRDDELAEWSRRRDELRQKQWDLSQSLLDKVQQMLVFPLAKTERRDEGGQTVTEVYPSRWNIGDAARLLDTAAKVGTQALGPEASQLPASPDELPITADELAAARVAVADWETQTFGPAGTKVPGAPVPNAAETD